MVLSSVTSSFFVSVAVVSYTTLILFSFSEFFSLFKSEIPHPETIDVDTIKLNIRHFFIFI